MVAMGPRDDFGDAASPKVTASIPTHGDRSHYLMEAVRGVVSQTMSDIEVYVSNDRGADSTPSVVSSFNDARLHHVVLPPPGGLHANLNACLRFGSAPYVAICQDDDVWFPNNLARLVDVMERHPNVVLAHGAFRWIDAGGQTLRTWSAWGQLHTDIVETGSDFILRSMAAINRVNMSSALIRRSALGSERFREADDVLCDTGLWMRLARRGDIAFVAEPLTALRIHGQTASVRAGTNEPELRGRTLREIELAQQAKKHFLSEYGYRGKRLKLHRRTARRWGIDEIVRLSKRNRSSDPFSTTKTLLRGARIAPMLIISPAAWRAAVGGLLGDRASSLLRNLLAGADRSR